MGLRNTSETYGGVTKTFHWLTALLILTAFPLGMIANNLPEASGADLATKALAFSLHKTLGVAVVLVSLGRIAWAIFQIKPGAPTDFGGAQAWLAHAVHWALYLGLIVVPLSGWAHHAATEGYAPILWPFGQSLPFVAKDPGLAGAMAGVHVVATKVLLAAILLHVAGALKHHLIDRDGTFRRMWFGTAPSGDVAPRANARGAAFSAVSIYLCVVALGSFMGLQSAFIETPQAPNGAFPDWTVQSGLIIGTFKNDSPTSQGTFETWDARLSFDAEAVDGTVGTLSMTVTIPSLQAGPQTSQLLGADALDAATHPFATIEATVKVEGERFVLDGTFEFKGRTTPILVPLDTVDLGGIRQFKWQVSSAQIGGNAHVRMELRAAPGDS